MTFEFEAALETIATTIVAKHAGEIDAGAFPSQAIKALGEAGLLGLVSSPDVDGKGLGLPEAVHVVERLARACASTAMVVTMHYAATVVLEQLGPKDIRQAIAAGKHLSTLAFSEAGSRSQFWVPMSTATADGNDVKLTASKSWVTSAHHADSYVWSSRPLAGQELSSLWLVLRKTTGLHIPDAGFDGLGLRGNDSSPIAAEGARIPASCRLGDDGAGFGVMMGTVLPWFNVLSASVSNGIMEAALARTVAHVTATKFAHAGNGLADLPTIRAYLARMRIKTDHNKALVADTLTAMGTNRPDTMLRVLESKAAAGESATEVTDLAMRICGGAAFRKESGVERAFRDARAAVVMGPTTDVLYDFIGKAVCGVPLF